MHLHAFIAILVPKLVAMVMPLCLLCTRVSKVNSQMAQTLYQNQTAWIGRLQLTLWPFLCFFGLFWPKFGCHGKAPYTLAITNVFFGLADPKNHTLESKIVSIAVTQAKLCRFEGSRLV